MKKKKRSENFSIPFSIWRYWGFEDLSALYSSLIYEWFWFSCIDDCVDNSSKSRIKQIILIILPFEMNRDTLQLLFTAFLYYRMFKILIDNRQFVQFQRINFQLHCTLDDFNSLVRFNCRWSSMKPTNRNNCTLITTVQCQTLWSL